MQVERQVETIPVDCEEFGTDTADVQLRVKQDLHLLVEVFDALSHDQFARHGLQC